MRVKIHKASNDQQEAGSPQLAETEMGALQRIVFKYPTLKLVVVRARALKMYPLCRLSRKLAPLEPAQT